MTDYSAEWAAGDLEFKAVSGQFNVDEAQGIVECFVAAVGNKDSVGDIVAPGAFDGSLRRRKPRVVWGHDWNQPIGKVLAIEEVPATDPRLPEKMRAAGVGGLLARVQFNLQSERGREAFHSVAFFGTDQEWSIGYKTIRATYDPNHQANVLQEVELFEVSPVLHGANQLTGTISIKAAQGDRMDSFQKSQWPMFDRTYAARIKADHPEIWDAGGNIKGDDQYTILSKIAEQGGKATTEDQIKALELREAWIARHKGDFQLPGVVAQMKWLAVGTRGEDHMKSVVGEAIAKKTKRGSKSLERRVLISVKGAWAEVHDGPNIHDIATDDLIEGSTSVIDDQRPGIGNAIADEMDTSILLRVTDENFVIFDAEDDDRTYFMPYHYEQSSGRYMFGKPMPVEIELDVQFDTDDEDSPYMNESDDEWEDSEEHGYWADEDESEMKAIGGAIGGGGARSNQDGVDHDGDGVIFDGTPDERPAPKKRGQQGANAPMRRYATQGGQTRRVDANGKPMRRKPPQTGAAGPAGPKGPGDTKPATGIGVRQTPEDRNRVAVESLQQMRRDINKRGSTPGGERAAGEQMRQVGAFLRAAEANDRARNGTPAAPAGPKGPGATVDRMSAAQRRREAVQKLQQRRREINRRGSTPGGERAAGREMQDVGRYLGAAEEGQRVRERQVAGRAAGPAGARGPKANYGQSEAGRTRDDYGGSEARMSNGFQQRYYNERTGTFRNVRTPYKSYDDPSLTIDEVEELETKGIGQAIGGGPSGQNPDEVVDRNNNGRIFDGTPDEQAAPKKRITKRDGETHWGPGYGPQGPRGPRGADERPAPKKRITKRDGETHWGPGYGPQGPRGPRGARAVAVQRQRERLNARRAYLASRDSDKGPKSTQANQREDRLDRAVAREQLRGWEPTANGRGLKPAAGRRGAMGPAGPRSRSGVVSTEPGSRFSPATRPAKGSETRWAPGAADAPATKPRRGRGTGSRDRYDGNAARMSNGFQQPYYNERTNSFSNMRTPYKSAYDPSLSADEWEMIDEKGFARPRGLGIGLPGRSIGGGGRGGRGGRGGNPLAGRNPEDIIDRNNDGWLFRGTPWQIRAARRNKPRTAGERRFLQKPKQPLRDRLPSRRLKRGSIAPKEAYVHLSLDDSLGRVHPRVRNAIGDRLSGGLMTGGHRERHLELLRKVDEAKSRGEAKQVIKDRIDEIDKRIVALNGRVAAPNRLGAKNGKKRQLDELASLVAERDYAATRWAQLHQLPDERPKSTVRVGDLGQDPKRAVSAAESKVRRDRRNEISGLVGEALDSERPDRANARYLNKTRSRYQGEHGSKERIASIQDEIATAKGLQTESEQMWTLEPNAELDGPRAQEHAARIRMVESLERDLAEAQRAYEARINRKKMTPGAEADTKFDPITGMNHSEHYDLPGDLQGLDVEDVYRQQFAEKFERPFAETSWASIMSPLDTESLDNRISKLTTQQIALEKELRDSGLDGSGRYQYEQVLKELAFRREQRAQGIADRMRYEGAADGVLAKDKEGTPIDDVASIIDAPGAIEDVAFNQRDVDDWDETSLYTPEQVRPGAKAMLEGKVVSFNDGQDRTGVVVSVDEFDEDRAIDSWDPNDESNEVSGGSITVWITHENGKKLDKPYQTELFGENTDTNATDLADVIKTMRIHGSAG